MKVLSLSQDHSYYPAALKISFSYQAPDHIATLGNLDILSLKKLAFFCSVKCPGHLILKAHDFAKYLSEAGVTVIGGFHSPVERECLRILLRGTQPIIVCPARTLEGLRLPKGYKKPLSEGRLLLLSPFSSRQRRNTSETALSRNRFVGVLADQVFIAHAAPNSKTESFCGEVLEWNKPVYTLQSEANARLISLGAKGIHPEELLSKWKSTE